MHLIDPADVELRVAEDVVDEGHVGPHVGFLAHVQLRGEADALGVDKRHNRLHLRHNKGAGLEKSPLNLLFFIFVSAYLDEGNSARGTHVLSIGPHLDGEVQVAHVEEGLHGQAGGVVREEDLLHLVRLEQLDIAGPGLLGAHLQQHRVSVEHLGGHDSARSCLKYWCKSLYKY